jgi:hypothetical protein
MTYPGESIRLDAAYDVGLADFDLIDDIQLRAGSRTLASGGHWKAWADTYFFTDHIYLGPADTGVVSWVVEVASGSATVTAAEGVDPDFGDETFTAGTALGSHALTAGTNVIASSLSAADVYDLTQTFPGIPMLDLQATSGSVVVQQVKLRVWPVGGAVGAWVEHPGFDTLPSNASVYVGTAERGAQVNYYGQAVDSDAEAAWDAAVATFQGDVEPILGPHSGSPNSGYNVVTTLGQVSVVLTDLAPLYTVTAEMNNTYALVVGKDPDAQFPISNTLVEGVDWWRPPTEVYNDSAYFVQQIGSGTVGWVDLEATVDVAPADDGTLVGGAVAVAYPGSVGIDFISGPNWELDFTYSATGTGVSDGDPLTLAPAGGRFVFIAPSNVMLSGAVPWNGSLGSAFGQSFGENVTVNIGSVDTRVQSYVQMPPYRVWNPDAQPVTFMRVMQRGDGLGMGSGRVFNQGTRQGSSKVFGTY